MNKTCTQDLAVLEVSLNKHKMVYKKAFSSCQQSLKGAKPEPESSSARQISSSNWVEKAYELMKNY